MTTHMTRHQWLHTPAEKRPVDAVVEPVALGRLVMTRSVNDAVADHLAFAEVMLDFLRRHVVGDWGDVDPEDWQANDRSITHGTGSSAPTHSPRPSARPLVYPMTGSGSSPKLMEAPPPCCGRVSTER